MNDLKRPILAVTMGDAAGVGPELCLRLLDEACNGRTDFVGVVLGSAEILERVSNETGIAFNAPVVNQAEELTLNEEVPQTARSLPRSGKLLRLSSRLMPCQW